jgi:PIN domain nuclease of toxin-antitoxin system
LKGYLLDTSVALLSVMEPERIGPKIRTAMAGGPAFLSIISYWEVMIKTCKGLLEVRDPRSWWMRTQEDLGLQPLMLLPEHISALYDLPLHHHDPFDRALIAQATVEDLGFLTTDSRIDPYASDRLRVLR